MSGKHFFICKSDPFFVLGPEKWLSPKELAEGNHAIYVFPDTKTAQEAQSILPKVIKQNTTVRNQAFIEQAFMLKFVPGTGFIHSEGPASGPSFSEPFAREKLLKFTLPARAIAPKAAVSAVPTIMPVPAPVLEVKSDVSESSIPDKGNAVTKTCLETSSGSGRDTTKGNNSGALFEDLIASLEKYVEFKTAKVPSLATELSRVDKEITDELHFVEFATANAADGYKSFRRLQDLRLKRRAIKDSGLIAEFMEDLLSSVTPDALSFAKRRFDGLKNRKYRVRIPETFQHEMVDGGIF